MSSFGTFFRVATFGESHGAAVGCVIEGLPSKMKLSEADIQPQLDRRRPGQSSITTQRKEGDSVRILSGTEEGVSLGTPIALVVENADQRKFDYANTRTIPRPGHADFTYLTKFGIGASSGGGRASARETLARVAAGAVAEKWLKENFGTSFVSWVSSVGDIDLPTDIAKSFETNPPSRDEVDTAGALQRLTTGRYMGRSGVTYESNGEASSSSESERRLVDESVAESAVSTRCPHESTAAKIAAKIREVGMAGDTAGGILTTAVTKIPAGIGEPCFDKLEAELAKAMLSLPATKGFEIGEGFHGTRMKGSEHNDKFTGVEPQSGLLVTETNHAGGTLGGISTGQHVVFRVAVKPVSSISLPQSTCTYEGVPTVLECKGRHDACVLPRAPPLVEAMAALVVMDLTLRQMARCGGLKPPVLEW